MVALPCRWLLALSLLGCAYMATRLPSLSPAERRTLAAQFAFQEVPLPYADTRRVRAVHPDLRGLVSWISSVGAAISIADLNGDGKPDDICYVDTSSDQIHVLSLTEQYASFNLLEDLGSAVAPTSCLMGDLNEDGLMDVLACFWGRPPIAYLQHSSSRFGRSSFVRVDLVAQTSPHRWYTNAVTRADVDGDGHADIIIGNYFQDGARILDPRATDIQHMHHTMSRSHNGGSNRVLLWESAESGSTPYVTYREVEGLLDVDVERAWTLAIAAADLDGDMLPEIYFANDFGPDVLLHNRSKPGRPQLHRVLGRKTFTTPNSKVLGRDSFKGMGADFVDINGDGLLDLYVSNIAAEFALEESHFLFVNTGQSELMEHGVAPFVERSEQLGLSRSGWGWESRLADFNNDGIPEAVQATGFVKGRRNRWAQLHEAAMGNDNLLRYPGCWHRIGPGDDLSGDDRNPFFVRAKDGRYYDLAADVGLGTPQVTRGIAVADVDADGDLDFAFGNQWEPSRFYRNQSPDCGASLQLRLLLPVRDTARGEVTVQEGLQATRMATCPAIGAQATLTFDNGQKMVAQVDGGNGHSGARSPEIHFGLGRRDPALPLEVDIRWRALSGKVYQTRQAFKPGSYTVVLGSRDHAAFTAQN